MEEGEKKKEGGSRQKNVRYFLMNKKPKKTIKSSSE